jgi:formylglycine-generating enzyme required for sulfatase activity
MEPRTEVFSARRALEQRPIDLVSWFGGNEYCSRAGADLPTQAQLWYVRTLAGGDYPWGRSVDPSCTEVAHGQFPQLDLTPVVHGDCESFADKGLRDVGTSSLDVVPGLGIKDLGGNVRQWAKDGFLHQLKPCDGVCIDPITPPQPSGLFALSGGAFDLSRWFSMSRIRGRDAGDSTAKGAGLRCVINTTTKLVKRETP